jgi:hypothetical protein
MFEFILFLISFIIITALSSIIVRLKNTNLQLLIAVDEAIKNVEYLNSKNKNTRSVEKEHLISFLNETRDVAYKYIEDVHEALLEYKAEIEYDLNHPNELSINKFKKAFQKLEKIYPKDIPND